MENALFIGNGINMIESTLSWGNLLNNLVDKVGKKDVFSLDKPFPILYEEIMLRGGKYSNVNETDLRGAIATLVSDLKSNDFHRELLELNVTDIITTNYDYCIENYKDMKVEKRYEVFVLKEKEKDYRLHTYISRRNKRVWHIHGEASFPRTIVLGHNMYSKVLNKCINYADKNNILSTETNSWIDLFFTHNIHILGFGCDYTEIDIWWLLNYRARRILQGDNIENKIIYYNFTRKSFYENNEEKKQDRENANAFNKKREVLYSHYVTVKDIEASNYSEFYQKVFKQLK